MSNNSFTVCSVFYSLMLLILYFRRKNIKNLETKIYSKLVIINFLNVLTAILCSITIKMKDNIPIINDIIGKSLLLVFFTWGILFTLYLIVITTKDTDKFKEIINKSKFIIVIFTLTLILYVYSLPLYYYNEANIIYSYGPSANFIYTLTAILMIFWIIRIIKNYKIIKSKKCIPILLFIVLAIASVSIQKNNPGLLLITAVETFITVIMYFTIENPDMKLLDEVHRSKEISDNANEEKTLFLYNMTQEIRNTTRDINENADIIIDSNDLELDKDCAREIKGITSKFNSMTNEILDVSKLDSSSIKVYNSKYNIKNILKEIVTKYSDIVKNKELDFRVNIDHDIPEVLYGDSIGLKNVLCTIIDNSVKYTKSGYIEFNVNTIIKNDICRLIITIEDSGMGIKSDDINKIKISNKSLGKALKLITLMNGTMLISSNYGYGTKVKVILDQKIDIIKNEDISKYEEVYDNINILMVDDSESGIKIIEKLIRGTNIKMDSALNGKVCLDKIKTSKYDVILLDEQLSQISAVELIKKIKLIRNFNTPVILLTKDNSYEYNDSYIKEGFSNYILKPVKKDELLSKIKKDK